MLASACYEVTMSTRHDSSARGDVRDEYSARASSWSFRSADTNRHVDLDISRRAVAPKLAETIGTSHVVVADVSSSKVAGAQRPPRDDPARQSALLRHKNIGPLPRAERACRARYGTFGGAFGGIKEGTAGGPLSEGQVHPASPRRV